MKHYGPNACLVASLMVALAACGDSSQSAPSDTAVSTDSAQATDATNGPEDAAAPEDVNAGPEDSTSADSGASAPDTSTMTSDSVSEDVPETADEADVDALVDTVELDTDTVSLQEDTLLSLPELPTGLIDIDEESDEVTPPLEEDTQADVGPELDIPEPEPALPFLESYGTVETLAGTAFFTAKAYNGWSEEYEGGSALEAELSRPHMTLADAQGRLFIADKDAHAIRRVDLDGTIHTVAGTGEAGDGPDTLTLGTEVALHSPNGIWVRSDGTVYILDLVNEKIRRLNTDGMVETFFVAGDLGSGRGLWVSDDEQLAWMSAGTVLKRWTPATGIQIVQEGFVSLGNLAVMPSGQLAVTDRGASRAWWVGTSGALMPLAGNGELTGGGDGFSALETGLGGLRGIWFPPDGGILLCAHSASKLYWVDPEGILHLMLDGVSDGTHEGDGEPWWTPGAKISEPRAVTMDHDGNILLTEHDGGFIRRIQRTGPLP